MPQPNKRRKTNSPVPIIDEDWELFQKLKDYPSPVATVCMSMVINWRGNVNTAARKAIGALGVRSAVDALADQYLVTADDIVRDRAVLSLPPWERPATHWAYGMSSS